MQIATGSFPIGPVSGNGPQVNSTVVTMPAPVTQAVAILTGFTVEFTPNDDHHLGQLDVQVLQTSVNGASVTVQITYGLRDWSDNWDDSYDGQIFFAVVGE